jgi:HEAT repeat protein
VEKALLLAEKRFRQSQDQTGGWGYGMVNAPNGNVPTPSMTCAGLLGVFLGFGIDQERKIANLRAGNPGAVPGAPPPPPVNLAAIQNDPAVQKALTFLGQTVGGNPQGAQNWLYFLWSLERVCVTYKLQRVNGVDWYVWGSDILLRTQTRAGDWNADHGPAVDTAFALLFLKKANLVGVLRAGPPPAAGQPGPREREEAEQLAQNLIKTPTNKQSALIEEYKTTRGADYTFALCKAIPKLSAPVQDKARAALAERLERLTINSVRTYLTDEDTELRRAAASAAGRKGKDEIVPDLIRLLKDSDTAVADAAHEALKRLSGKSFEKDVPAWEAWWKGRGK